jgi:signal transduction histidine kinase
VEDEKARAALEAEHIQWSGGVSQRLADGFLVIHRSPIFTVSPQSGPMTEGFLVIGIRDGSVSGTLMKLNAWQLAAAGLLCLLVVPVSAWVVARWTAPLEDLRHAVALLIRGEKPAPITVKRADDLGHLCLTFNQMVRSLYVAQVQLHESNAKLESMVKQRTAEVRHMNTKLEAEAEDKNEFLRAVSHDLNAPLRNIAGMSQVLLMKYREQLADDAINKLERISANAKHQTELIGDLLELSRLRTRPSKPEVVDLKEVVHRLAENLSHDLEEARIELSIEGEFPKLYIERNRIRQVFQNLMDNAIKYMLDSPERRIVVRGEQDRDYQPNIFNGVPVWKFTVIDTGKGISEQDLPRIFQVFSRATHSGTHHVAGRGVGLASVRTIVEQLGGRIWVESVLGRGSTFTFTIPASAVNVPQEMLSESDTTHAAPSANTLQADSSHPS